MIVGPTKTPLPMSDDEQDPKSESDRPTPGGPYFGRLLIVLFIAVAFCAFMTWLLNTLMTN